MITAMATTTKSTRKTTVKPAKSTTVRKTTTKKATVTKAPAKNTKVIKNEKVVSTPVKADKKDVSPLERLRSMHLTTAALYILFAGLVLGFVKTAAVAVTLPFQARDEFASKEGVVLGSSHEVLYNIEPKYLLAASLLFGAVFSILLATKLRNRYESTLTGRVSGLRWISLGVSSSLLLTYVYMLAGLTDVWILKLSAIMILVTTALGWIAERDNSNAVTPKWLAYVFSLFTGAFAWLALAGTFIGTALFGDERFSWSVYAIALVTLLGFIGFAVREYRQLRAVTPADYVYTEAGYFQIDLFTKFAVVLLSLIALK